MSVCVGTPRLQQISQSGRGIPLQEPGYCIFLLGGDQRIWATIPVVPRQGLASSPRIGLGL